MTLTIQAKQKGHFELDQATGLAMNNTNTSTIDGITQLKGKRIPITIITNKTLVGKKLNTSFLTKTYLK